ncbi:YpbS family protein [Aeribacillus pallidus]|uniref:YpbS family protein n=1 Tax=Aeribacillus pallidus TaxID=33936 RepID=UPI003D1BA1F7
MSEVHFAITKHSQRQHEQIKKFLSLNAKREEYIEEAVQLCQNGQPFSVDKINAVTDEINELAKQGIIPTRKRVTEEMVREYVERLKNEE